MNCSLSLVLGVRLNLECRSIGIAAGKHDNAV